MKKFLFRLFFFGCFAVLLGEIFGHYYNLPFKFPSVMLKDNVRVYKPNQSGFYSNWFKKITWQVNDHGYLGVFYLDGFPLFSVIGDSYIVNIANPLSSNQGYLLREHFPQCGFIEAGVTRMNLIEAMEITKVFNKKYQPDYHLIYVSGNNDFYESIQNIGIRKDVLQIKMSGQHIMVDPPEVEIRGKLNKLGAFLFTNSKTAFFVYKNSPLVGKREKIFQWLCGEGINVRWKRALKMQSVVAKISGGGVC